MFVYVTVSSTNENEVSVNVIVDELIMFKDEFVEIFPNGTIPK